jgi:hypothetical protein
VLRELLNGAAALMPRVLPCAGCCLAAAAFAITSAQADEPPTVEVSGGGEISGHTWSAYTNTTVALSGLIAGVPKSIREDGWRLRAGAGYWEYARRQTVWVTDTGNQSEGGYRRVRRLRTGSYAEVLLGYHAQLGELTLKAFAGAVFANEKYLLDEVDEDSPGVLTGGRFLLESWYNFGPNAFLQIDVGWTSEPNEFGGRARVGYRLTPQISLGPEVAHWRSDRGTTVPVFELCRVRCEAYDRRDESTRYGGFIRYEWTAGEVSVSGGIAADGQDSNFYASLNALLRF